MRRPVLNLPFALSLSKGRRGGRGEGFDGLSPNGGSVVAQVLLVCVLAGCQRVTDDMGRQPRHNPDSASPLFADQQAARPPVPGTVVRASGDMAQVSSGRLGLVAEAAAPSTFTDAQVKRGQARYTIYCLPCHGASGAGDGEVVRRGFPAPPPFSAIALREAPDARLQAAIRQGAGVMYPFADRVSADDAWAIVAYLRVLQGAKP